MRLPSTALFDRKNISQKKYKKSDKKELNVHYRRNSRLENQTILKFLIDTMK